MEVAKHRISALGSGSNYFGISRSGYRRNSTCDTRSSGSTGAGTFPPAIHAESYRTGAYGQARSGLRARSRDPTTDRYPHAPPSEQPDSYGRGGRWQNRGG